MTSMVIPGDDTRSHVVSEGETFPPVHWRLLNLHRRRKDTGVDGNNVAARADQLIHKFLRVYIIIVMDTIHDHRSTVTNP